MNQRDVLKFHVLFESEALAVMSWKFQQPVLQS